MNHHDERHAFDNLGAVVVVVGLILAVVLLV